MLKFKHQLLTASLLLALGTNTHSGNLQGGGGGPQPEVLKQMFSDMNAINKNVGDLFDRIVDSEGNYYMLSRSGQLYALGTFEGGGGPNENLKGELQGGGGGRQKAAGDIQGGGGGPQVVLSAAGDIQGGGGGPQYVMKMSTTVDGKQHTFTLIGDDTRSIQTEFKALKSGALDSDYGKILEVQKISVQTEVLYSATQ